MKRISKRERYVLVDKIRDVERDQTFSRSDTSYNEMDYATGNSVEALMDRMKVRQKVLMAYQNGDILEKRRYGNLLKRLQRRLLNEFKKGTDTFVSSHLGDGDRLDIFNFIHSLAKKHNVPTKGDYPNKTISDLQTMNARDLAYEYQGYDLNEEGNRDRLEDIVLYGSQGAELRDEYEMAEENIEQLEQHLSYVRNSEDIKEIKRKIYTEKIKLRQFREAFEEAIDPKEVIEDLMGWATGLGNRTAIFHNAKSVQDEIDNALNTEDVTDQVVAYEKVLNAVHNNGPLMEYVFFPQGKFRGQFVDEIKTFLDGLSNMTDTDLDEDDKDYILQQASIKISQYDGATLGDLAYIQTNYPEADFWIVRKGSDKTVGSVTKEFKPQHIGIKVIATETLDPGYLYYALMNIYNQGYFRNKAIGSLNLKHIRVQDIKEIPIG